MSDSRPLTAIVLAAGQGKRMHSPHPKVLLPLAGRPMLQWTLAAVFDSQVDACIVVVGHQGDAVAADAESAFPDKLRFARQEAQRGTADAVRCALPALSHKDGHVLILYGDCPLIEGRQLHALIDAGRKAAGPLAMLTTHTDAPEGYGRIIRGLEGKVLAVREDADCAPHERDIGEINPGVYWVAVDFLLDEIGYLDDTNAQGEFYLTDLVASAARRGGVTAVGANFADLQGVNDRYELSLADRRLQQRLVADWARRGVFFRDPASVWLDASVSLEAGAEIGPQVHLRGRTHVSAGAIVDVGCVLEGVSLGPDVRLAPYTVARDSELAEGASAGPFTHLRPGSELAARAKVGNFVEMKQTRLGPGSKASHLSYLGDGVVGAGVNIGAGTIFCNYDGAQKHRTVLEDGVFVGSDSQLVAPVRVGQGAYIATGTTVTRDVSADALAISRPKQDNKEGYAKRLRAAQAARVKKTSEGE